MRRLAVWLVLMTLTLMSGASGIFQRDRRVAAQETEPVRLTISFDEAGTDALCADAMNAYRPELWVEVVGDTGAFGPSIVVASGEASGLAPECQISPGDVLVVRLNRPAYAISFNRYGTVGVTLTSNGDSVGTAYDVSSGLGGRYERTELVGFDQIVLAEDSGTTPLLIDELDIVFARLAVTSVVDFSEIGPAGACVDAINTIPTLTASADSTTGFEPPMIVESSDAGFDVPQCQFDPGNLLTISLPRPAIGLSFDLYGGADLQLFLNGAQVGTIENVQGLPIHFSRTRVAGFDQIVLTEPSGFSSFQLDNLMVTFLVEGQATRIDFEGASAGNLCADVMVGQGLDVVAASATDFDPPFISDTSEAGATPACEFNPGNSLTITLPSVATGLSFTIYGGAEVQLLRDGVAMAETDTVGGLPRYYVRLESEGFDQIVLTEPSGFSSFKVDNIQIIYGE